MLRILRTSIVFRSTFTVLSIALLVGSMFAVFAYYWTFSSEQNQTKARLRDLISTVENTASISCYLTDKHLASEVANGLLKNEDLHRARIFAGEVVLVDISKIGNTIVDSTTEPLPEGSLNVTRDIFSPFNPEEQVCKILLEPDTDYITTTAKLKARLLGYLLAMQAAAMAAAVVYVVLKNITRPIKNISDSLHNISATSGARLAIPRGNKDDEIGQLVIDTNTLISKIVSILDDERNLRLEHAIGEKKFKAIFENSETGIFLMKSSGEILSHNQAFCRLLGIPETYELEQVNSALGDALEGQQLRLNLMIEAAKTDARVQTEDFCIEVGDDQQKKWISIVLSAVEDEVLQGLVNDITDRKLSEEEAKQLAVTDHLTGAYNRLGFEREMARIAKDIAKGKRSTLFLLLIDLDHFKEVNDAYGHEAGDKVLRHFNQVLIQSVRKSDFIARLGGDEFVVLLKDLHQQSKAEEIAQKIIEQLQTPIEVDINTHAKVGASIGITFSGGQAFDKDSLLRQADEAMYDVKNQGKNAYRLYQPS